MIYTLESEYGNIIRKVEGERARDRLLGLGYKLINDKPNKGTDESKAPAAQSPKQNKGGRGKKNAENK